MNDFIINIDCPLLKTKSEFSSFFSCLLFIIFFLEFPILSKGKISSQKKVKRFLVIINMVYS